MWSSFGYQYPQPLERTPPTEMAKQELRFGEFISLDEMLAAIEGVDLQAVDALREREGREWARVLRLFWLRRGRRSRRPRTRPPRR